ncbi:ZF-HD homeobox protein [Acorus gramineus]|uniref:ZF-HD homeobox protein n=1 Tax=Acorus gramineus TaxID=55184 RepID=A0AAV9AIE5_ACOGR|nr:ZF-HD homeobox protein [Acorus gramineus]
MEKEHYGECLRNHAASLGSYATDGCGEFIPDDDNNNTSLLHCAACSCHRNFHRKVDPPSLVFSPADSFDSDRSGGTHTANTAGGGGGIGGSKKRVRTKFTEEQKERMLRFAESIGWRVQRTDVGEDGVDKIGRFCRDVGVTRQVFKVWMHNHKNSCSSSSVTTTTITNTTIGGGGGDKNVSIASDLTQ